MIIKAYLLLSFLIFSGCFIYLLVDNVRFFLGRKSLLLRKYKIWGFIGNLPEVLVMSIVTGIGWPFLLVFWVLEKFFNK